MPTFGTQYDVPSHTYNHSGQYSGYPENHAGFEFPDYQQARHVPDQNSIHPTYNNSVHAPPYAGKHYVQQVPPPLPVLQNAKDFPPLPPKPEPANVSPFADPDSNPSIQAQYSINHSKLGSQESDSSMTLHTLNFPVPPTPHTVSSHNNVVSTTPEVKAEHRPPPLLPLPEDSIERKRAIARSLYGNEEDAYTGIS